MDSGFSLLSIYMYTEIDTHIARNKDRKLDKINIHIKLLCTFINIYKKIYTITNVHRRQ